MSGKREADSLVVVRWAADEFGAGVIAAKLGSEGITTRVVIDDPMGTTGFFGATSPRQAAVLVRREDAERADAILKEAAESGEEGVDWAGVDVGEPVDDLARRIEAGDRSGSRGWWWGGWPAAIVLLVGGFVALGYSSSAAMVLWLAALIASIGSGMSWMVWRLRAGRRNTTGQ